MKHTLALGIVLVLLAAPALAETRAKSPGTLKVGFSQIDITPPVGLLMTGGGTPVSKGIEDPIKIRTMVVSGGGKTIAIVGMDLIKIHRHQADEAIALASKRTGIHPDAIMICASHNHSSPFIPAGGPNNKEYVSALPKHIANSIAAAYRSRRPARMYLGRSLVYDGLHNRRVITKSDGMALNTWFKKLDDLKQTPQVLGTEGPIDPEMWVARFDSLDGKVLGTLVNFTCHPNYHGRRGLKWSADFPGVIADHMSETYGEKSICVFTQGASGNINPNFHHVTDWRAKSMIFATAAERAAKSASPVEGPIKVGYARRNVKVPRRDPKEQRKGAVERLGWRKFGGPGFKSPDVPVNAARIGPLGIATNAGELFVEWGISIKKRSPFPHTILCELTNEAIGYEPTAKGFKNESYEALVGANFVPVEGIQLLVDTAVELLEALWKEDASQPRLQ